MSTKKMGEEEIQMRNQKRKSGLLIVCNISVNNTKTKIGNNCLYFFAFIFLGTEYV